MESAIPKQIRRHPTTGNIHDVRRHLVERSNNGQHPPVRVRALGQVELHQDAAHVTLDGSLREEQAMGGDHPGGTRHHADARLDGRVDRVLEIAAECAEPVLRGHRRGAILAGAGLEDR